MPFLLFIYKDFILTLCKFHIHVNGLHWPGKIENDRITICQTSYLKFHYLSKYWKSLIEYNEKNIEIVIFCKTLHKVLTLYVFTSTFIILNQQIFWNHMSYNNWSLIAISFYLQHGFLRISFNYHQKQICYHCSVASCQIKLIEGLNCIFENVLQFCCHGKDFLERNWFTIFLNLYIRKRKSNDYPFIL